MIIYQIHEHSGMYEDFRDTIVGTYLKKDKAEQAMKALIKQDKAQIKLLEKCRKCPIDDLDLHDDTLEVMQSACIKFCKKAEVVEKRYGYDCENRIIIYDDCTYYITEIEVIE